MHSWSFALAGRDAREDQHSLTGIPLDQSKELSSLILSHIHFKRNSILSIVEHFQQTPRPGSYR